MLSKLVSYKTIYLISLNFITNIYTRIKMYTYIYMYIYIYNFKLIKQRSKAETEYIKFKDSFNQKKEKCF